MDDNRQQASPFQEDGPRSLERLLAHYAQKTPDNLALVDPPNRGTLEHADEDYASSSYSFKQLDHSAWRLAIHFAGLGLQPGDYVGVQMPNVSDTLIVVLALMRARLVPCMMPLSWNIGDVDRSCNRLKLRALISCGRFEGTDHSEIMRELAFRNVNIRFVLGFSSGELAEGVENLSHLLAADGAAGADQHINLPDVDDLALVTYIDPVTPLPYTHGQILSMGLLQVRQTGLSVDDAMLSAYPLSSVSGLAGLFAPWLICGCSLTLHHPFDLAILQQQLDERQVSYLLAPPELLSWLRKTPANTPARLALVWRADNLPAKSLSQPPRVQLFDMWNLSDMGVVTQPRTGTEPAPLFTAGRLCMPDGGDNRLCIAQAVVREGRLYVKGRIFPSASLLSSGFEWFSMKKCLHDDFLDTGLQASASADETIHLGSHSAPIEDKIAS